MHLCICVCGEFIMTFFISNNKYFMPDAVSVMIVRNSDGIDEPLHTHDFIEIVYMLKGECVHTIDGKNYPVSHGDMLIINYNQTHSISGNSSVKYINILIKPEYISKGLANSENAFSLLNLSEFEDFAEILDKSKNKIRFSYEERARVEDIITSLVQEMKGKAPGHELYVRSQFNILLLTVFRKMCLNLSVDFRGISEELLSYIRVHCSSKLTSSQVAKMCSYNSAYFSRAFRDFAGVTFTQYIKSCRIERAKQLIDTTDMRVADIAYEVGYANKTKFYSDFRSVCGMSPLGYRKRKNAQNN